MDKPLLAYTLWLSLTAETKKKLIKLYNIPRTGESVVHVGAMVNGNISGEAKQDGHKPEDLYAITPERSYELLNEDMPEEPNFYGAFEAVLQNIDDIYYERYPDEKPVEFFDDSMSLGTPEQTAAVIATIDNTEEFIPRDPEELIKMKAETLGGGIPGEIITSEGNREFAEAVDSSAAPLPESLKSQKNATTKKGRPAKAK